MVWDEESGFTACSPHRARRVLSIVARESHCIPAQEAVGLTCYWSARLGPSIFWRLCWLRTALDRKLLSIARRTMTALRADATAIEPRSPSPITNPPTPCATLSRTPTASHRTLPAHAPRSPLRHPLHHNRGRPHEQPARVASHANGLAAPVLPHVHGPHVVARSGGNVACDARRGLRLQSIGRPGGPPRPGGALRPGKPRSAGPGPNGKPPRNFPDASVTSAKCTKADRSQSRIPTARTSVTGRTPPRERPARFRPHRCQPPPRARRRAPRPDAPVERGSRVVCGRRAVAWAPDRPRASDAPASRRPGWISGVARSSEGPKPHYVMSSFLKPSRFLPRGAFQSAGL